jgi:hypothetical protein
MLNSLVAFIVFSNHSYVQSHKIQLLSTTNYFDVETANLFKDDISTEWIDTEEVEIDGIYFDVMKIVSLGNGKSRVYVYADDLETGMTKGLKDQQKHEGKKHQQQNLTDLFKIKTYTKYQSLATVLCVQELAFANLSVSTQEGYMTPPFHPPSV